MQLWFSRTPAALEIGAIVLIVVWLLAVASGYTFDGAVNVLLLLAITAVAMRVALKR